MKHLKIIRAAVAGLALGALAFSPALARAATASGESWNEVYRADYDVPRGIYTGKSPFMRSSTPVRPAPAPSPAAPAPRPPTPTPQSGCSTMRSGPVMLAKTMPGEAIVGQEFMSELKVTAIECAANVVITDLVPAGSTYVRSEPAATVDGDKLTWRYATLEAGEVKSIKVWLKPEREGMLLNCASISADPRICAVVMVGKPNITIQKTGPQAATIGADVAYNIVVRNTGTAVARNVVVTDPVPEGLTHASGQREVTFSVGDLGPGASKNYTVSFKAAKRGKVCNVATVNTSNAGKATAEACTTIMQPGLKIEKVAKDKELFINRVATYDILVSNTGDTALNGVTVTDAAAPETKIVEAVGGTVSGNLATWRVGDLPAGGKKTLTVKLLSAVPGRFCNTATATTAEGLRESSQACTDWAGVTGVLVEVVDDPDPIQVGESTTFTIRVTNQGTTKSIEDINIVAMFKDEMDPTTASNSGAISGKNVKWPTVSTLAPKQSITYTLKGKGVKAGDHRLEVQVTTKLRSVPITELESTTVY